MSSPAERRMIVSANHDDVRKLAAFLQDSCRAAELDEMTSIDLELAMVEAANNVVEHSYVGGAGEIELSFDVAPDQAVVTLADHGLPVPDGLFERCRAVPANALGGRGIGIVQSCVDRVEYRREGDRNQLRLVKVLPARS